VSGAETDFSFLFKALSSTDPAPIQVFIFSNIQTNERNSGLSDFGGFVSHDVKKKKEKKKKKMQPLAAAYTKIIYSISKFPECKTNSHRFIIKSQ